jgi:AraC family transcriptional regulator of adaptative response/methylated-DNA-[protein]-cysteine methyltransferase
MTVDTSTSKTYASDSVRWAAVQKRDACADGQFYYSVRTTGVFCRPSCGARAAKRCNVAFHDSIQAAMQAGFRPCLRCKPEQPALAQRHAISVAQACRLIEQSEQAPDLVELAAACGLSRFHLHRIFKAHTGITPLAYAAARRAARVAGTLTQAASVTDALYAAGYNSSARFYAEAPARLGMSPAAYRAGAPGERIRYALGSCSLGELIVGATERGICAILLGDDAVQLQRDLRERFPRAELLRAEVGFEKTLSWVIGLIDDPAALPATDIVSTDMDLALDVRGTAFQQRVWQALRKIPRGSTVSYSELAALLGMPRGARAVALACAANPLAVAIPCHRVLRHDGALSGYRWGIERKRALLEREAGASKPGADSD